jgi:fumarate hydratase subunit beta
MSGIQPVLLHTPLSEEQVRALRIGNLVHLSGALYTARDAAHRRMHEGCLRGESLPFDPAGQVVYYVGPTPAKPGRPIGSAGPTTASRMDPYAPLLIERGLKGMIGKGRRSAEVRSAMRQHGCVYFGAVEGTAALLADCVKSAELIAYEDLDAEAIRCLVVENFPVVVINDCVGGDLYEEGRRQYQRSRPASSGLIQL